MAARTSQLPTCTTDDKLIEALGASYVYSTQGAIIICVGYWRLLTEVFQRGPVAHCVLDGAAGDDSAGCEVEAKPHI